MTDICGMNQADWSHDIFDPEWTHDCPTAWQFVGATEGTLKVVTSSVRCPYCGRQECAQPHR